MAPPVVISLDRRRSGRAAAPIALCAAESLVFAPAPGCDEIPAGMTVALMTPEGKTLAAAQAYGINSVNINTDTQESRDYTAGPDDLRNAVLFVGDGSDLRAAVPVTVRLNRLAAALPPTAVLPIYPTAPELEDFLVEISAARAAAETASAEAAVSKNDARAAASDALGAKIAAENAASRAETSRQGANRDANRAQTYARQTSASADAAKDSAYWAGVAKDDAETRAGWALESANNAAKSERTAQSAAAAAAQKKLEVDAAADKAVRTVAAAATDASAAVTAAGDAAEAEIRKAKDLALAEISDPVSRAESAAQKTAADLADVQALSGVILEAVDPALFEDDEIRVRYGALCEIAGLPVPPECAAPVPASASVAEAAGTAAAADFKAYQFSKMTETAAGFSSESVADNLEGLARNA